jgi:ribosomal protein L3 glutamine methyltransferase
MTGHPNLPPDVIDDLHTLLDFVRWGASRFNEAGLYYGHGTDNSIDDALALVLHVLNMEHGFPDEMMQARLARQEKRDILDLFRQRIEKRMPVPYITQKAWFAGLPFYVNEHVLIPRSPLGELIEQGFAPWCDANEVNQVLDLCTGSGCIGIATAISLPHAEVDLSDISEEALHVAQHNLETFELVDTVQCIRADVYDGLPEKRYDLIVSNPPYVSNEEMATLPEEFLNEPSMALAAGDDGLDIVRRILAGAADYLTDNGILIVEVGNSEVSVQHAFPDVPFIWLEFERGGDGVFLLSREQLVEHEKSFSQAAA